MQYSSEIVPKCWHLQTEQRMEYLTPLAKAGPAILPVNHQADAQPPEKDILKQV